MGESKWKYYSILSPSMGKPLLPACTALRSEDYTVSVHLNLFPARFLPVSTSFSLVLPSPLPVSPSFRSEDRLLPCQVGVVKEGNMLQLTLACTTAALKFDFLATRRVIFLSRFIYVLFTWPRAHKWSIADF